MISGFIGDTTSYFQPPTAWQPDEVTMILLSQTLVTQTTTVLGNLVHWGRVLVMSNYPESVMISDVLDIHSFCN